MKLVATSLGFSTNLLLVFLDFRSEIHLVGLYKKRYLQKADLFESLTQKTRRRIFVVVAKKTRTIVTLSVTTVRLFLYASVSTTNQINPDKTNSRDPVSYPKFLAQISDASFVQAITRRYLINLKKKTSEINFHTVSFPSEGV